jgi:hypothetical protein
MNDNEHIRRLPLSIDDLIRYKAMEVLQQMARATMPRSTKPWPPFYNQSGNEAVDKLRGIKTLGDCYTHPTFEAKLI